MRYYHEATMKSDSMVDFMAYEKKTHAYENIKKY